MSPEPTPSPVMWSTIKCAPTPTVYCAWVISAKTAKTWTSTSHEGRLCDLYHKTDFPGTLAILFQVSMSSREPWLGTMGGRV